MTEYILIEGLITLNILTRQSSVSEIRVYRVAKNV